MTEQDKIAVVIVTFNRSAKLSRVLDQVINQNTELTTIYVIDNASTDDTAQVVSDKKSSLIQYIKLDKNIGGAGGFYEGLKSAYEDEHDYFWVMDDDCYPEPDALNILYQSINTFEEKYTFKPSFACSNVRWVNNDLCEMNTPNPVWDWPRFYSPELPVSLVGSCSFVSVLIPAWAVAKHGYPIKEYFIWYDDAEYTQRIAGSYPGIFCPTSIVIHDTPENKGVNYSLITSSNLWKFKYGARNEASYKFETGGLFSWVSFLRRVKTEMGYGNVSIKHKLAIYKAAISGLRFRPARKSAG